MIRNILEAISERLDWSSGKTPRERGAWSSTASTPTLERRLTLGEAGLRLGAAGYSLVRKTERESSVDMERAAKTSSPEFLAKWKDAGLPDEGIYTEALWIKESVNHGAKVEASGRGNNALVTMVLLMEDTVVNDGEFSPGPEGKHSDEVEDEFLEDPTVGEFQDTLERFES